MAFLSGWPSGPRGWNASNNAVRSFSISSLSSVSERICTVAESPLPTITTASAGLPNASLKTSSTCWVVAVPLAVCAGMDTFVPPSKSMPKVKPRITMLRTHTATINPLIVNHSLRLPTTSNAPVPV